MSNYIDGYFFPLANKHKEAYRNAALQIASIWKEHGALEYFEFLEDGAMEGIKSFRETIPLQEDESIVFGWIIFPSKAIRDLAHEKISQDTRMTELVKPLMIPTDLIFDASRMVFNGFKPLVG